jgi:hypothetical protein
VSGSNQVGCDIAVGVIVRHGKPAMSPEQAMLLALMGGR